MSAEGWIFSQSTSDKAKLKFPDGTSKPRKFGFVVFPNVRGSRIEQKCRKPV